MLAPLAIKSVGSSSISLHNSTICLHLSLSICKSSASPSVEAASMIVCILSNSLCSSEFRFLPSALAFSKSSCCLLNASFAPIKDSFLIFFQQKSLRHTPQAFMKGTITSIISCAIRPSSTLPI